MKKILLMIIFLAFTCMGVNAQNPWNIDGNNNVNTTHFLGTKNLNPVIFKTNDEERMRLINHKSFLGIGVQNPMASLHLHYQTDGPESDPLRPLLQLTTNATGNAAYKGFSVFSDYTTNDIRFMQHERAKFFIEGINGGLVIARDGNIGMGTENPKQKLHLDESNLLITSTNSGTTSNPTGALLFSDVIDESYPNGKWGIEYLNSLHPTYGGSGLNFRRYINKIGGQQLLSVLFLADNGRIGIGTKDPQAALDVTGGIKAIDANISGTLTTNNLALTGFLGLGTPNPQQKLHLLNGNILLTNPSNPTAGYEKNALVFDLENQTTNERWGIERINTTREKGLNFWKYGDKAVIDTMIDGRNIVYTSIMFFDNSGKVGIGTTKPQAKFDVKGGLMAINATITNTLYTESLNANSAVINGALNANSAAINGALNANSAAINGLLSANNLKINGLICSKELRVMSTGAPCWPDFVFSKEYNLMPLNEVEQFITKNQHLPNVPSATEVEENGFNVGEMNATLLKKVEELTLYIIQIEKRLSDLESK